ncbi:MAG: dihydrofolate reductase family protein [Candidatus Saccharibacteria bacterium]|nr:dihydrofolate reductase family protein [Candidatus Saccharibacteria bacterium]
MRKIIVLSFITLDGVMQAPGGPEEDTSGGFTFGGWAAPYFDEESGKLMDKQMQPADLLLGRRTFDIFASYWPKHEDIWPGVNNVKKYVVSNTLETSDWQNSVILKDIEAVKALKNDDGGDLQVHGSGELIQSLLKHDLVDELWLKFFPVTLGQGKKLFDSGVMPAAFTLVETSVTPSGVIFANYKRAGAVKTGTVGE